MVYRQSVDCLYIGLDRTIDQSYDVEILQFLTPHTRNANSSLQIPCHLHSCRRHGIPCTQESIRIHLEQGLAMSWMADDGVYVVCQAVKFLSV